MTVFEDFKRRGLIAQCTNLEKVEEALTNSKVTFYIGFDATADSLHVGHFLQLMVIRRMQLAGHLPILLLGTGTTMIGDPTGKTDMRKMLTVDEINKNADLFVQQMGRFVDLTPGKAIVARNGDWLMNLNYIELLRDVGVHFSVNHMLAAECVKSRLERGLTFLEFNYMIMQSYDFYKLNKDYNCTMEFGGDDQWSNILGGIDLTRKMSGKEVYGMTFTLLTTKEGKKMGKTEKGALWLDAEKTSPYEFFQYWRNVADEDVINCLKLLTFLPVEEIEAMESWKDAELNKAKEILAFEVTKIVHGEEEATKALSAAKSLFGGSGDSEHMPSTVLDAALFTDGEAGILDILVATKLAPSKGEARRLVQQGGIAVDDQKVTDINQKIKADDLANKEMIIKKGKKVYHKISM